VVGIARGAATKGARGAQPTPTSQDIHVYTIVRILGAMEVHNAIVWKWLDRYDGRISSGKGILQISARIGKMIKH
jgi:hypothetical protein